MFVLLGPLLLKELTVCAQEKNSISDNIMYNLVHYIAI